MNVLEMVRQAVRDAGGDGLVNVDGECSCLLDDLAPCGLLPGACRAGRRIEDPYNPGDWVVQALGEQP